MTLADPAPRQHHLSRPRPAMTPRRLRPRLPRRPSATVSPATRPPGIATLRSAAIALSRLPHRPPARRSHARRWAVPLLWYLGGEPALAPLQQTHPRPRPPWPPPSLPSPSNCWIFGRAHGSPCSRRTKSRGRAP